MQILCQCNYREEHKITVKHHGMSIAPYMKGSSPVPLWSNVRYEFTEIPVTDRPHLLSITWCTRTFIKRTWPLLSPYCHLHFTHLSMIICSCCGMFHKSTAMSTPKEKKEFGKYLEIHKISSLQEIVVWLMVQAFPAIEESKIKTQPSDPLPPKQFRCVSTTLVTHGSSVELDVPPMQTPLSSNKETGPATTPFTDEHHDNLH